MAHKLTEPQIILYAHDNNVSTQRVRDAEAELIREVGGHIKYWLMPEQARYVQIMEKLRGTA